ncbi:MAG: hypothetical protein GXO84_09810 [Chlorobi bacterium]|nr:hypothetical protein [Chlorobiota bacterium]
MKIKVTKRQFKILLDNLCLVGEKGLQLTMSGKAFKKIMPNIEPINEQKMFKVGMWFGPFDTITLVYAHNSSSAMIIARKMFPKARVYSATQLKGKLC